ncbi:MAG: molybdopterin-binding protein [Paracoccus sp. (in: a-proteobacteria)]|nr:molybdopterin-binding protein [Paracoccus sp. (in: a-proteobacteria)]
MLSDNPTAAIIVIGDEILSGRTREGNAHHLAGVLNGIGIDLREVRIVSDDHAQIAGAIKAMDRSLGGLYDLVFTSGGIGPTHDDITADAVAAAFGVGIDINPEARAVLEERWAARGVEITPNRLRMARIPFGAKLIPNSVSAAPGFVMGGTHVMAGVPEVFRAMVEAVIPWLRPGRAVSSLSVDVPRPESDVADPLRDVALRYPALSLGSYPWQRDGSYGTVLVVRGLDEELVGRCMDELKRDLGLA